MNQQFASGKKGSVLLIALVTITIVTLISVTTLFVAGQNSYSGMQTAGWQQALTGAESGIDAAVRALNAYVSPTPGTSPAAAWSNWYTINTALPTPTPGTPVLGYSYEPNATATPASAPPSGTQYNYLPSSKLTVNLPNSGSEGAAKVQTWVTIDTAGMLTSQDANGKQWYRVRSTAQTSYPSGSALLRRVSNTRLDNDLRNTFALHFSRKGGSALGPTRTIEVVLKPLVSAASGAGGLILENALQMSGGGVVDHFDSGTTPTSTFLTSPSTYRSTNYNETLVGMLNANGSDLKSTYVYGQVSYSTTGAAPKNTTNIQGTPKLTTPFSSAIPTVTDPTGTPDATYAGGSPPFTTIAAGTKAHPKLVKITGNFTVSGGNSVTITAPNSGADNNYIIFWVTGDYTTSGSGFVTQAAGVNSSWYIDGKMTTSGSSYINGTGEASSVNFYGVGNSTFTISGSGSFVGTITAPNYSGTISGTGSLVGSVIASTLTISGGASFHYDDALSNSGGVNIAEVGNFAFASWFEDNSNPTHKDSKGNAIVY